MPGVIVHIHIAEELYRRRNSTGSLEAILAGALAPDIGLFPGSCREISRLSHHSRTGELAIEILSQARTRDEELFAQGWISHCLADVAIHPLINQITGSLPDDNMRAHIQVEGGLDAYFYSILTPSTDFRVIDDFSSYLHRCYRTVYGPVVSEHEFITAFHNAHRFAPKLAALSVAQSCLWGRSVLPRRHVRLFIKEFIPLKVLTLVLGDKVNHSEFAQFRRPSSDLASRSLSAIRAIPKKILEVLSSSTLADWDLDSGELENRHSSGERRC